MEFKGDRYDEQCWMSCTLTARTHCAWTNFFNKIVESKNKNWCKNNDQHYNTQLRLHVMPYYTTVSTSSYIQFMREWPPWAISLWR